MWMLNRSQIALHRADLMFGSIAEDGSLTTAVLYIVQLYSCEVGYCSTVLSLSKLS